MSVHYLKARSCWFSKCYEGGKEKRRYFKTEQEARAYEAERLSSEQEASRLTLGELVSRYFQANPDKHISYKKDMIRYAESLNRQDLEHLREVYRRRGASNKSININHAYISAVLAWGLDQELIAAHPWLGFKKLKDVRKLYQPRVEDLQRLYREVPDYLQWAVKTAFFLALRPGQVELFGLLWTAFNWRRGIVTVRQGKFGRFKTVVSPEFYLAEGRSRYEADMGAGIPLVCHRNRHRVLSFRTSWKKACARAGVQLRPYDIRHIAATEMLARGADLAAVAAQLGHCSVATTGAVYAHITEGSQARAVSLMPGLGSDTDSDTIGTQDEVKK